MLIRPSDPSTYTRLIKEFQAERRSDKPKELRGYIERNNQPPISAFMNVCMPNHQGIETRIGHLSLSLATPIQMDIIAWAAEQKDKGEAMRILKDALTLDIVPVSSTRTKQAA